MPSHMNDPHSVEIGMGIIHMDNARILAHFRIPALT